MQPFRLCAFSSNHLAPSGANLLFEKAAPSGTEQQESSS